jgi:hypothetical protein
MRHREVTLSLGAQILEVRGALGKNVPVGMDAPRLGPALCQEAADVAASGCRLLVLPGSTQPRYLHVADHHHDRPARGEQAGVQQGQPRPDGQPRAAHQNLR